jgi:hypothetical protein
MIIPNKHSGYQAGIRLYPFGGGGGSSQPGMGDSQVGNTGGTTGVGTGISVPPPPAWSNMAVNTEQGYNTLMQAKGQPWEKSGNQYNDLLNQGFTSNQIRDSATQIFGAPSNANWSGMVQNAGMNSPTGRPMAGSDQFYQPVYQSQYQNYANPYTAFNVSTYGTQPMQSPISAGGASRENINNAIGSYVRNNPNADMNTMQAALRDSGMNPYDVQGAGGFNNYSPSIQQPQMNWQTGQMTQPTQQAPFNPYTNSFGGGFGGFGGYGGFMPQMQSPYSYQQPMQQAQPVPQRTSSGPSQAIVSRSSQMRGTPNVMRRAEGGIASLMDDE